MAKAIAIARRVAKNAFEMLEDSAERDAAAAIARKFAPEAGNGLLGRDWAASPVPEARIEKPPLILRPPTRGAAGVGRKPSPHSGTPEQRSKGRSAGVTIGAVVVLTGLAVTGAFQLGLLGESEVAVSNPAPGAPEALDPVAAEAPSKAETEAATAEARRKAEAAAAEARRKAEAEAAAAEARRKAEAEAAAAEARRKAEAEAAAAEARRKAEAEAAAAEARRKAEAEAAAAEARRKAEAEAATAEARKKAEAEAAKARKKAEAAAAEARRKAEAAAAEAERRERRTQQQQAPSRPGSNAPIIHGE